MTGRTILQLQVTAATPPDVPGCFNLRETFPTAAADQLQGLLERLWPMLIWSVTVQPVPQPDEPAPINSVQVPGTLAPDGSIWGDDPGVRWLAGTVKIHRCALAAARAAGWVEVALNGLGPNEAAVQK